MADRKKGFREVARIDGSVIRKPDHLMFNETVSLLETLGFKLRSWAGSVPELIIFNNAETGAQARILYHNDTPEKSTVTLSYPRKVFPRRYTIGDFIVKVSTQLVQQRVQDMVTYEKNKRQAPPAAP